MPGLVEKNLEYERAEYAYKCIKNIIDHHGSIKKEYRSELLQTPARIYNSGLLQNLTFYCSKMDVDIKEKKPNHFILLNLHLMEWILRGEKIKVDGDWKKTKERIYVLFKANIIGQPENKMLYTERAMSVIVWMKRFAEGMIEK
jgi:CRISPR type III-B/RAMP module-associated protein Cmr5